MCARRMTACETHTHTLAGKKIHALRKKHTTHTQHTCTHTQHTHNMWQVAALLSGPDCAPLLERYRSSISESYVEDNRRVKWCPSIPHCGAAVRVGGEPYVEPTCRCGFKFCFNCTMEPHSPCTCDMYVVCWSIYVHGVYVGGEPCTPCHAPPFHTHHFHTYPVHIHPSHTCTLYRWKSWKQKCEDDSETKNWLTAHTKPCPKCDKPVHKDGGCNLVVCACGQAFCWLCGSATGRAHTWKQIEGHSCGRYREEAVCLFGMCFYWLLYVMHGHDV